MATERRRPTETRKGFTRDVQYDDSVTVKGKGHPEYAGKHVTRGGEEYAQRETEAGRVGDKSTARQVTGIGPQNPIDKKSPHLP